MGRSRLTTTLSAGYNNKSGNDNDTYSAFGFDATGPNIVIYDGTRISSGFITGNSLILEGGNNSTRTFVPASLSLIRGDLTYYQDGWMGSHEFGTGFFIEPQNIYDQRTDYVNDGFFREYQTVVDVANPSRGTVPYRRDYASPLSLQTRQARDSNYAFYLQDGWKPNARLTANIGMRFDYVKRVDEVRGITRQKSWTRAAAYWSDLPPDRGCEERPARQLLPPRRTGDGPRRGHDVWLGRHGVATRRSTTTTSTACGASRVKLDSCRRRRPPWPASRSRPACISRTSTSSSWDSGGSSAGRLDSTWAISTARTRTCGRGSTSTADIPARRVSRSSVSVWSIPNQGIVYQQTNNTWSQLKYQAIEMTVTKNMSRGFQFIAGFNRQWHKIDGTWNPTDPARFVQPDHFANNANLYMPRGNNDENSLPDTGNALSYGPTWMKYRGNFGAVWQAPWGINVAGNLTVQAGPWSGSPLYQLSATDPDVLRYGPASIPLANGSTAPNPLATRNRYVFSDRGEGQVQSSDDQHGRLEGREGLEVPALPGRGGGEHLQPAERWELHPIQLQQCVPELELELPADGQSAAGARVPVDDCRPLLSTETRKFRFDAGITENSGRSLIRGRARCLSSRHS